MTEPTTEIRDENRNVHTAEGATRRLSHSVRMTGHPYEQLTQKQLEKMGIVCRRGQTVNGLDTQIGFVEAGLGVAVIASFGVLALRNRKARLSNLEPAVTLEFYEISNRGRKLSAEANEFSAFLKSNLAHHVGNG